MNNYTLPKSHVVVLFVLVVVLSSNSAAVARPPSAEAGPLLSQADGHLICDGDLGGTEGAASFRGVKYDRSQTTWLPQRFNNLRANKFLADDQNRVDANRDGHFARHELAVLDDNRRRQLLLQYDNDADGQLSRYELPRNLPEIDTDEVRNAPPVPEPLSPQSRKPFENLRRFGLPKTRQASTRSKPFARAATFGTGPGVYGPQYRRASAPSCRATRSSTYWLRVSR